MNNCTVIIIVFDDKQLFEQLYNCSNNCFVVCLLKSPPSEPVRPVPQPTLHEAANRFGGMGRVGHLGGMGHPVPLAFSTGQGSGR